MRTHIRILAALAFTGTLLAGCGNDKAPAEAALKAAEAAVSAVKADAARYLPDRLPSLEATLAGAKDKLGKGDYKGAVADAQTLTTQAKDLASAAATKKAELVKSWDGLSAGMPQVLSAVKSRVDLLSASAKLPAGMTADQLASAKSGLAELGRSWAGASQAYKAGNVADAVTRASAMKPKAASVLATLGMPVPEALKG
jgi:hypothetical protein